MYINLSGKIIVTMFGRVSYERGFWHNGRSLNNNLILYLISGELNMQIENNSYTAKSGDVMLIPKGTFYRPLETNGCSYYFFHFNAETSNELSETVTAVPMIDELCEGFSYYYNDFDGCTADIPVLFTPLNQTTITTLLKSASKLDLSHDIWARATLELYFRQFITALERGKNGNKLINPTLNKILYFITDNITTPISLSEISREFNLSESYIARMFKKNLGISAGDYIIKQKINVACGLLINTDMSIMGISEQLGFSNQYYFSRVFSDKMKITPSKFRKNIKREL